MHRLSVRMNVGICFHSSSLIDPSSFLLGYLADKMARRRLRRGLFELSGSSLESSLTLKMTQSMQLIFALTQLYKKKPQITQKNQLSLPTMPLTDTLHKDLLHLLRQSNVLHNSYSAGTLLSFTLANNIRIRKLKASYRLVLLAVECNSRKVLVYKLFSLLRRLRLLRAVNYVSEQLKRQHYLDCCRRLSLIAALGMHSLSLVYSRFVLGSVCSGERVGDGRRALAVASGVVRRSERARGGKKCFDRWLSRVASGVVIGREKRMQLVKLVKKLDAKIKGYYATSLCNMYNDSTIKKTRVNIKLTNHKVPPMNQL